LIENTSEF